MRDTKGGPEFLLDKLCELSGYLTRMGDDKEEDCFERPLEIMNGALGFDLGVLYEITNVVENHLILKVVRTLDPKGRRPDLVRGRILNLDLDDPPPTFINEAKAYALRDVSAINVPGSGCDMMGYIYLPESMGGGYLFGGDYLGLESDVRGFEKDVCEIMCNLLSAILMKQRFRDLAVYDSLTGLLNSRTIREKLESAHQRFSRKPGKPFTIVLGDIDFFKKINDTYGHIQGDAVLREVGALIASSMREDIDMAGRYGGEEFLLIYEETDPETAKDIVERLRGKIAANAFTRMGTDGTSIPSESLKVTMSFGLAAITPGDSHQGAETLLARADGALYHAKENGRNQVSVAGDNSK